MQMDARHELRDQKKISKIGNVSDFYICFNAFMKILLKS